jgi:hypothetical protein
MVGRAFYPSCSAHAIGVSSTFLSRNAYPVCGEQLDGEPIKCDQVGEVSVGLSQGTPWTTGGSFSGILRRAAYQNEMVENYLEIAKSSLPPSSQFNASNQAYADVSTIGYNLLMSLNKEFISIGGTSSRLAVCDFLFSSWRVACVCVFGCIVCVCVCVCVYVATSLSANPTTHVLCVCVFTLHHPGSCFAGRTLLAAVPFSPVWWV